MTKIRIPRKLKKNADKILAKTWKNFPNANGYYRKYNNKPQRYE